VIVNMHGRTTIKIVYPVFVNACFCNYSGYSYPPLYPLIPTLTCLEFFSVSVRKCPVFLLFSYHKILLLDYFLEQWI
jgi:hypothetical protein